MSECERAGKLFGSCRFEPRYDIGVPDTSGIGRMTSYVGDVPKIIDACRPSSYVHDICIRCGKVAQRTPSKSKD